MSAETPDPESLTPSQNSETFALTVDGAPCLTNSSSSEAALKEVRNRYPHSNVQIEESSNLEEELLNND